MSDIVYRAYEKYLVHNDQEKTRNYLNKKGKSVSARGNIWSSDIGKCERQSILRTLGTSGEQEFSVRSLDYMNTGVVAEDVTLDALRHVYGDRLTDQVVLKYKMLSGKADFGIDIGTDNPVVIEHKMTGAKFFDSDNKSMMPRHEHIGQAMSYCYMYEKLYGITPTVILFYKSWGNFAEYQLTRNEGTVQVQSNINGVHDIFERDYDVYADIDSLIKWYESGEIPPRLEKKYKGCEFMGRPSCKFYDHCWK